MFKKLCFVLMLFALVIDFCYLKSVTAEEITITTYYPSPYGSYDELTANKMKIGSGYSASDIAFESDGLLVEGKVGIGITDPQKLLHVNSDSSQGSIGISGKGDGNETYSGIYLDDDTSDLKNSWVISHKKRIGIPAAENAFYISRWDNLSAFKLGVMINQNMNVGIGSYDPQSKLQILGSGNSAASSSVNVTDSVGNSKLFVRDDGRVGIGTTTPIAALDVAGIGYLHVAGNVIPSTPDQGAYLGWNALTGGTGETDFINNQGGGTGGFAFMNTPLAGTPRTTLMHITGNGNVGIGTTNPAISWSNRSLVVQDPGRATLAVRGPAMATLSLAVKSDNVWSGNIWNIDANTAGNLLFSFPGSTAMFLKRDFGGTLVLMGQRTQLSGFDGSNNHWINAGDTSNPALNALAFNPVKKWVEMGPGWWFQNPYSSSLRYKRDIKQLNYGLTEILKIIPKKFYYKDRPDDRIHFGFIAEEMDLVIPELVSRVDGKPDGIYFEELIPVLANAIKEQQKRIDSLEEQLKELKIKIK